MKNVDNFDIIIWSDALLQIYIFFVGCCPAQILMRHWWFGGNHAYFEYNKGSGVVLHAHTAHVYRVQWSAYYYHDCVMCGGVSLLIC